MTQTAEGALERIRAIAGPKGVVEQSGWAPYLEEWRGRWHGKPSVIVAPGSVEEISRIVRICNDGRIGVTPQGGNTGLVGGQIPLSGEVLILMKRLRKVREVSALNNSMIADAGVTLAEAQGAAEDVDRLFPLSIGSEGSCQIGGVVSTNAGGVNVLRYGNTRDLVLGIEVVLASGEVWNSLKSLRKDNTGYDLKQLFIGGEGTLGVVTAAVLKLFPRPRDKATIFAALPTAGAAVRLLSRAQQASGGNVTSFELMGQPILDLVLQRIPGVRDPFEQSRPWSALIELSAGEEGTLRPVAERFLSAALEAGEISDAAIADNSSQTAMFWRLRHSMAEAMRGEGEQAKHDVSVAVADAPEFLKAADAAVEEAWPGARVMAFGHMGDGNIHYDVLKPLGSTEKDFGARIAQTEQAVYEVIGRFNGSISAEHGVGLARREEILRRKPAAEIMMMRAIKAALDPRGIMNPSKMLG